MADNDVPVSDVLCEAMEYLAKLGSNLRSRSETLKEKKIRKDKLKNAHAVQKAANKVLLICELSKKSLDNVESGVRKILDIVDATQASTSDGGKTFTRVPNMTSSSVKKQFHYIEYQSKKLKIAKKISIKHFTSAKVKAKRMSMSKHDRYPVYHDCKLYRIRHKKNSTQKTEKSAMSTNNKGKLSQQSSDEESDRDNQSRSKKLRRISDDERSKDSSKEEYNDHVENTKSIRVDTDSEKSESNLGAKKRIDSTDSETKFPENVKDKSASKKKHRTHSHSRREHEWDEVSHNSKNKLEFTSGQHKKRTDKKMSIDSRESDSESCMSSTKKEQNKLETCVDSDNGNHNENYATYSPRNKNDDYNDKLEEKTKDRSSSDKSDSESCKSSTKKEQNKPETSVDSDNGNHNENYETYSPRHKNDDDNDKLEEKRKDRSSSDKSDSESCKSSTKKEQNKPETCVDSDNGNHNENYETYSPRNKNDDDNDKLEEKRKDRSSSDKSDSESCKSSTKKEQNKPETSVDSDNGNHNENYETYSPRNKNDGDNAKLEEKRKDKSSDIENTDKLQKCIKKVRSSEKSEKFESNSYTVKSDDESGSSKIMKKIYSSDSESDSVKNSSKNEKRPHSEIRKKSKHNNHSDEGSEEDKNSDCNLSRNKCMEKDYKYHKTSKNEVSKFSKKPHQSDDLRVKETHKDLEDKSSITHKDLNSKEESSLQENHATNKANVPESETEDTPFQLHEDSSNDTVKCKEKENDEVIEEDEKSQRPIIKCVSLNRLLKPDVLKKDDTISPYLNKIKHANEIPDKEQKSIENSAMKSSFRSDKTIKKAKRIRFQDEEEEEYWAHKRKEVKAFKSKSFVINILRMPILSFDFLQQHNLSKVTKNGKIICKISTDADRVKFDEHFAVKDSETQKDNSVEPLAIDKVKSALLIDSDSEKSESSVSNDLANRTKNIMESLLNDSDSDSNEIQGNKDNRNLKSDIQNKDIAEENLHKENSDGKPSESEKIALAQNESSLAIENRKSSPVKENSDSPAKVNRESSPCKDIESSKDCNKITPVKEDETLKKNKSSTESQKQDCDNIAKSSLLNDSSSSSPEKSKNKLKTLSKSPKRKHIMESMHAKRMLLTYSSSSETEDEQLSSVIKEIKDSLLKGISSDEEISPKKTCKKLQTSSDSDGDLTTRVKKRKKVKKSNGTTPNEESDDDGSSNEQCQSRSKKMGRSREKASSSSSHNSDNRDDKDVHGLTNLKSLGKSRRRQDSSAEEDNSSSKSTKKIKMPKEPLIKGEGLLEVPITSDEGSGAESDAMEEDLPPVSLSGLNGSGIEHLAKDDLLGDTDSESSNEKEQNEDSKKEDSETDENVKLKRRKAPAISSDSEAGSSRRKEQERDGRSDFEDSEDGSETTKRSKRKKKSSDSDASGGSSNEGKKKRRRIKQMDSDVSGSDTENEGRNKHGRKNIRKVMGKNQLEEATKKAARQEKERMARIAERQRMYNNLEFDESGKPDEVVLDKVVLDFDPETKEPLIEVDRGLVKKLKPHQANGIKFMWDACFESVKRIKKDRGSGCILAHCMGLGKTLQVVSLTHTLLTHSDLTGVNRVLVVCPLSTVLNWVNEFRMWLKHSERDFEVDVYELSKYKQNSERAFQLSQWFQHGGVCVLGYEMFRNLSADNNKKFKKKMLRNFQESLVDPGPDLVVCDEGHLLKNEKTSLSQSMNRVKTHRRIVLTGTPLQNNLKEYYCMVQFVKPNLLGKYNEYLNRFVNPITNGQYTDSTEHDIRVMKRRSHVLHKMLDGAVQRRDYGVLAPFLPPKHEYVLFITLTDVQVKLYQHYLENYSRRPLAGKSSGFLFPDFQSLQRIWTHPLVLKYNSERYEIMQQKKREREEEDSEGSLVDFIDDDSTPEESSTEESSDDLSDVSDDSRKKSKKNKSKKSKAKEGRASTRRGTRANPVELVDEEVKDPEIVEVKNDNPTEWWMPLVTDDELEDLRHSHKLVLLFEILRQCEAIGDKLLVFSQSLYSLDLIEHFLGKVDEATQEGRIDEKLGGHVGSWSPGIDYFRLDGSTSCENRSIWCKNFNREDNPRARLFLISTRAGGLGINLVAANRVIIFDVSWNPSHDVQSIFRVYRFGQKKPCYIYRFLAMGTMEEKIYERQVTKQAISKRVIDEQQIDRHYAENDLAELYKFEPQPPSPRPVPLVPKDRFFAEMLKEHEALIYKFHEHDSLLENKEEETLSEEERKAAWEDFENEKNRPPPAAFPNWPMHNGMVPNLLAQQQQQLAYAALATMLRKDMPNLSDDQIRSMLPLIYGANPALMQKLSDMYKYTQPGMMNPAMMNPAMNAAGATGAMGGGGTSGLQYEPPWQRQQQQQQQMRLQQLMQQQQNQMGAKYYAGGLGSRDPVAMALQQQRAREIMLGERARPRGRPPLQPRLPAAPGDVVNLDSD